MKLDRIKYFVNVAFADDLAVLISAYDDKDLQEKIDELYKILNDWCIEADLTLNVNKTQCMSLGNRRIENLKLNDIVIKLANKIKYLGIVIDKNLIFKDHLKYLEEKTEKFMLRTNKFNFLKTNLEIKFKKHLYFSVYLPMISYASKIWFKRINHKVTFLNRLRIMQNRAIKCLTKIYKNTKTKIMYKIFKIVDIVKELEILDDIENVPKNIRRNFKNDERNKFLKEINYDLNEEEFDVDYLKHRFSLWCLSGIGPFKEFLFKIKVTEDNYCRFCHYETETSTHLLYDCIRYKDKEFDNVENKCIYVINDLLKHKHLLY